MLMEVQGMDEFEKIFPFIFPFFFVGMWCAVLRLPSFFAGDLASGGGPSMSDTLPIR